MTLITPSRATEILSKLLCGAELDTIRLYSTVTQFGFLRFEPALDVPKEIWLSVDSEIVLEKIQSEDVGNHKSSALDSIRLLIGIEVTEVNVEDSGKLMIRFNDVFLCLTTDEHPKPEEIWSVTSESPNSYGEQRWQIALDVNGNLSARTPE